LKTLSVNPGWSSLRGTISELHPRRAAMFATPSGAPPAARHAKNEGKERGWGPHENLSENG
jgi:hypothetical protein